MLMRKNLLHLTDMKVLGPKFNVYVLEGRRILSLLGTKSYLMKL
jgi:hypothetical protein